MTRKDDYQRIARAKLKTLQANLAKLEAKADQESAEAKLEINQTIRKVKSALQDAEARLGKLLDAGEDAFDDMKEETEAAWRRVEDFFSTAQDEPEKAKPDRSR